MTRQTPPLRTEQEAWALVLENTGLVKKVVDQFCQRHSSRHFEDYYSAGQIGAYKAALHWDPSRTRLSTFFWSSIWWECDKAWKNEEARAIGYRIKQPDGSRPFVRIVDSVDPLDFRGDEEDGPRMPHLTAEESFEEGLIDRLFLDEQTELALEALSRLSDQDQDLIEQHIMLGRPFRELAEEYEVTHETVRNRLKKALERLRAELDVELSPDGDGGNKADRRLSAPASSRAAAGVSSGVEEVA